MKRRLTLAQAVVSFLKNQYSSRDSKEHRFFEGCFGIFGHGNVAGIGQALEKDRQLPYYLCRNEQAMVHTAAAFAKASFRLRTLACTTSIGPGATNMVTGAAAATVNRLPVLLLPGDIFARRNVAPVLQQLESWATQDISVNDCFKPISRFWDRIERPEQLLTSLPEAMRVLTSPSETGAVTLSLLQDVQAEAFDFPEEFFHRRIWEIPRNRCDQNLLRRAAEWIRAAKKPLIVAGGGVLYSEASEALSKFAQSTGIPVCETQAGKGALPFDHPQEVGAVGVTGTPGANILAREADLVLGIGTRYSDFTSASKTAFQNPELWRTRQPGGYHLEYGYSCMGYEIAGGLGAKMAQPNREVYVMVGDGSYLMMAQEIVTSLQEGVKLCGNEGMGTAYRHRQGLKYDGEVVQVTFAANAASLGAWSVCARTAEELKSALASALKQPRTSVVVVETSYEDRVPGYESWWDVPIAEVSERESVRAARKKYEEERKRERLFF